jgi:pimeloyl-ACP methyl ester carboxylesterase
MSAAIMDGLDRSATFTETAMDRLPAGVRCASGGSGPAVVILLGDKPAEPTRFQSLLAEQSQVFLVRMAASSPAAIGDVLAALGVPGATLMCRGAGAAMGLRFALDCPHVLSRLVLLAPQVDVTEAYAVLERPVLVLEGTTSDTGPVSVGQQMAGIVPECYDVLVYDATDAMDIERPEAVAEVVGDFVARGGGFIVSKPTGPIHP